MAKVAKKNNTRFKKALKNAFEGASKRVPAFVVSLWDALREELLPAGINAEVTFSKVPGTRLFRFLVLAKEFKNLRFSERQDLVWRIASSAMSPSDQLLVSMIVTMTPNEANGN